MNGCVRDTLFISLYRRVLSIRLLWSVGWKVVSQGVTSILSSEYLQRRLGYRFVRSFFRTVPHYWRYNCSNSISSVPDHSWLDRLSRNRTVSVRFVRSWFRNRRDRSVERWSSTSVPWMTRRTSPSDWFAAWEERCSLFSSRYWSARSESSSYCLGCNDSLHATQLPLRWKQERTVRRLTQRDYLSPQVETVAAVGKMTTRLTRDLQWTLLR